MSLVFDVLGVVIMPLMLMQTHGETFVGQYISVRQTVDLAEQQLQHD